MTKKQHRAVATAPPGFAETALAFWRFLKAPRQLEALHEKPAQVWPTFLQLFLLKVAATFGFSGLVFGVLRLLGYDHFGSHRLSQFFAETHPLLVLLAVAIVGPAVEEYFFRSPLRYTRMRLFVAFLAVVFFVLPTLLELIHISTLVSALIWLGVLTLAIWVVLSDLNSWRMRRLWERHYGKVFYTFAIVFALVHLANYENLRLPVALIPLLVVPQFIGALFWGYLRLRFSLTWAMVGHGLFNALIVGIAYLAVA
jgi:membrane protease YdiL (CAAX protease family)